MPYSDGARPPAILGWGGSTCHPSALGTLPSVGIAEPPRCGAVGLGCMGMTEHGAVGLGWMGMTDQRAAGLGCGGDDGTGSCRVGMGWGVRLTPRTLPISSLLCSVQHLTTSRFPLPTSHFPLPTSHSPLPTPHFPLPTSHFPLPTSHFPLPTSYFLLPTSYVPARMRPGRGSRCPWCQEYRCGSEPSRCRGARCS